MLEIIKKYFDLRQEKDASASYLIFDSKEPIQILNYQVEMIVHNPVNSIIPMSINQKNNRISLVYKNTLKQPLDQFLKNKKLRKYELIQIIKNIFKIILNCKNYLLNDRCFLLNEQYIYINPSTLETALIYIPVALDYDLTGCIKDFIIRLLTKTIKFNDEYNKENFIQKVLNYVKDESFSIIGLYKLLIEIRDEQIWEKQREKDDKVRLDIEKKDISISSKISIPQEVYLNQPVKTRYKKNLILAVGLVQVLLFILILITTKAISVNQKNDMSSISGLIIIAGVVDFIILRKFFDRKSSKMIDTDSN